MAASATRPALGGTTTTSAGVALCATRVATLRSARALRIDLAWTRLSGLRRTSSASGAPVEGASSAADPDVPLQVPQAPFELGWFVGDLDHPEGRAVVQPPLDDR